MQRRKLFTLSFGFLIMLFIGLLIYELAPRTIRPSPKPPELGGQQVPAKRFEIRFDQKYDVFCAFDSNDQMTFRDCKILGFTGGDQDEFQGSGLSGSKWSSYAPRHFDQWLVLELADARLAYIPPNAVRYIEEASKHIK